MRVGARYRCKATGSVYEVQKLGPSLSRPCVLRMVEFAKEHRASVAAEAQRCGDDIGFELQRTRARKLEVEPAWFEFAAVEVKP